MTLLRVHRKAITEADAEKLVEATYRLEDPFGVPTLFIRPENYEGYRGGLRIHLKQDLWNTIEPFIRQSGYDVSDIDMRDESFDGLVTEISNAFDPAYIKASCLWFNAACDNNAQHYEPLDYKAPSCSIVSAPRKSQNIHALVALAAGAFHNVIAADLPISNAHLQFYTLWHEIGHGAGADEPQTEIISSIMMRRSFDDVRCMTVLADMRAIRAMEQYDDDTCNEKYGWPMVDALDYARFMPTSSADVLSEEDITSLRFLRFDYQKVALCEAANIIGARSHEIKSPDIVKVTKSVLDNPAQIKCECEAAKAIALRFSVAIQRLSGGRSIYQDDSLEQQLWDEGYTLQSFPKDAPEFLPCPSLVSPL